MHFLRVWVASTCPPIYMHTLSTLWSWLLLPFMCGPRQACGAPPWTGCRESVLFSLLHLCAGKQNAGRHAERWKRQRAPPPTTFTDRMHSRSSCRRPATSSRVPSRPRCSKVRDGGARSNMQRETESKTKGCKHSACFIQRQLCSGCYPPPPPPCTEQQRPATTCSLQLCLGLQMSTTVSFYTLPHMRWLFEVSDLKNVCLLKCMESRNHQQKLLIPVQKSWKSYNLSFEAEKSSPDVALCIVL